jgi:hypothetical protein
VTIFWICMLSTEASRIKAFIYIYIYIYIYISSGYVCCAPNSFLLYISKISAAVSIGRY